MDFFSLLWKIWTGMFAGLPYGEPYMAVAALILLFLASGRLLRAIFG